MKLSEICIRRPVLAWVMTLILILLGLVGWNRLPLQQYPTFESPFLSIETQLPGASPEIVEEQVTRIIEDAVSGIEGIDEVTSISSTEESKVNVSISSKRSVDDIANDIRDRLNKAKDKMDDAVTEPILSRAKSDDRPIISLALISDSIDREALADFALKEIQKDVESLPGVGRADVLGAGEYMMHIQLDPVKLSAYNLTVTEVIQALRRQNIEKPAGKLISQDREYLVTTVASLETPEEFNNTVVAYREGFLVHLYDIGQAKIDADDRKTKTFFNGKMGVTIQVVKQATANPLEVAREVKKFTKKLKTYLPEEITVHIASDKTKYIEQSLNNVQKTILEAIVLVVLVVLIFLRSLRASIIPLVTIPVSLIGTMFFMYLLGFSLNIFTFMAMVLAIGLVVDDAIVVLENVYRYLEAGYRPFEAAVKGIKEISFAVIAMTFTLAAVYSPVPLAEGLTGKLLTEFAITLSIAVIISGFVALTLSPMMCARLLKHGHSKKSETHHKGSDQILLESSVHDKNTRPHDTGIEKTQGLFEEDIKPSFMLRLLQFFKNLGDIIGNGLEKLEQAYARSLARSLTKRGKLFLISVAMFTYGILIYNNIPQEFVPREEKRSISIEGQAPQSSTLDYTERYVRQIDAFIAEIPEVDRRITNINNPTFDVSITLKKEGRSTDAIKEELTDFLKSVVGLSANVKSSGGGLSNSDREVSFAILGNKSHKQLKEIGSLLNSTLRREASFVEAILSDMRGDTLDYILTVRRNKVSSLNIEPATIAEVVDALIRGKRANSFKKNNKLYQVKVEVQDQDRQSPHDITNLFIKSGDKKGTLVPLSELVTVESRTSPVEIARRSRQRAINMSVYTKPGTSLGSAITQTQDITKEVLPKDMRIEFTGDTKRYLDESYTIILVFGLALGFIYLVMAAQFESWRDPFIIMFTVPMALAGGIMILSLIPQGSINLFSKIGLLTLVGLITKHGIMMVDFANEMCRNDGRSPSDAIQRASVLRLRPILMTTLAMVFGALPLALNTDVGSEFLRQIGWVIVGGMSIGTLFTLYVVPAIYTLVRRTEKPLGSLTVHALPG
jgi:multidrug efflux pump